MRSFLILLRKEMGAVFLSPVAYVTIALFMSATAWTFLQTIRAQTGRTEYPEALLFISVLIWMPFLITIICMRLFAEEKRSGTIETLLTTAVGEWPVVMAKFSGALFFCALALAPAIGAVFVLVAMSPGIETVDDAAVMGGVSILGLIAVCLTAIGVLVSLLTRNQIVAAICCFWAICLPFILRPLMRAMPFFRHETIERYSLELHVTEFVSGTLSLHVAVLYLSVAVLMLFAAVRILESRRWL